jgi:hypothetical protein
MAVMVISTFEATMDEFNAVNEKLPGPDNPPQGGLVHTAGVLPDGRMQVADVWESDADWQSFRENVLGPVIFEVIGPDAPTPELVSYELHDFNVAPGAG